MKYRINFVTVIISKNILWKDLVFSYIILKQENMGKVL